MFGAGIYFAATPESAQYKSIHGPTVTISVEVFLGFQLEVPFAMPNLTKEQVYSYGCHSVKGLARSGEEYVVLEAKSILRVVGVVGV
jgi:hypothetical protein